MLEPEVSPQIILGSPKTGAGSDSLARSLNKFNGHIHSYSSSNGFSEFNLTVGDVVTTVSAENLNLFPVGTTLVSYSNNNILLSNPAIRTSNNGVLQIGNTVIRDVTCVSNLNLVTREGRAGIVSSSFIESSLTKVLTGTISTESSVLYPVLLASLNSCNLKQISVKCLSGSASINLTVENRSVYNLDVSSSDLLISSVTFTTSALSSFYVDTAESVYLSLSNISVPTKLFYTLYYSDILDA